ncbi:DUF4292 domain-containing protein [Pontibacter korlensis]|uniref:Deoxyuridine 5'-triphosphate nucleotidohydrolase n=1 Tax=Pontibacter korlensis TaxID=400092 RepID=A0A0E3ZEQ6_9BACT|nr:DUF4292 domain-containing protein [Pontibacter korlensis]AKD02423.1 hypothetical protein PKOR_03895 [Pontibacter korlensis]
MSKHMLLFLFGLLLLAGCKKETAPTTASTTTTTVGEVKVNNLDFTYLSTKGQITLNDKNDNLSSGVSIRMQKDSVIWVSVLPGLGIEAARMMLTQDSVYFMNRLKKEYAATDYGFLRNKLQVDVNFDVLQAILLGNYQSVGAEKVMSVEGQQYIQQQRHNLTFDYYISNQNSKLQQLNAKDINTGNTITVKYNSFEPIGQVPFAYELIAQILQKGQVSDFTLKHSRVTISDEPLSFPFGVPGDYKHLTFN